MDVSTEKKDDNQRIKHLYEEMLRAVYELSGVRASLVLMRVVGQNWGRFGRKENDPIDIALIHATRTVEVLEERLSKIRDELEERGGEKGAN